MQELPQKEGIVFNEDDRASLKQYGWLPIEERKGPFCAQVYYFLLKETPSHARMGQEAGCN